MCFHHEERTTTAKAKYKINDRVRVNYGYGWDGEGTVSEIFGRIYSVSFDNGRRGGFEAKYLTLVERKQELPKTAYKTALQAALNIAARRGVVTIDDVQSVLSYYGYNSTKLGNAAGAIFRDKRFRKTGTTRSTRASNRGRTISQWELVTQ